MQQANDMTARIGANFSDYQGNPNLGPVDMPAFNIDTRPLMQLAQYTFEYNRSEYNQRQKDAEAKAKQLADITAYDLTSAIPGDREKIQKGYNDLFNYVQQNPDVLDYKNNPKGWMEYNKKKNDFENQLQGGKTRSILYKARQEEVTNATNVNEKARLQKELDAEATSTDLMTPLKHTQLYDVKPVEVEAPPSMKIDVSTMGANFLGTRTFELPDMASVDAQAQSGALGFTKLSTDPTSSEYQAQSNNGKLEPVESSKNITAVLQNPKYKDPQFRNQDGTLNIDAVIKDNAGNGLVSGVLTSVKQYNDRMDEMTTQIKNGYFQDKLGKQLSFGAGGGLNENNYRKIDLSDGFTPDEILKVRILGKAKPIQATTKIEKTGIGVEQQKIGVDYSQLNETIRHNKATEGQQRKELEANIDKWKSSTTGGETEKNGAMVFAKKLYDDLGKLADKNGVISPEKIRLMNIEQRKYLGLDVLDVVKDADGKPILDANNNPVTKTGLKPLELGKNDVIQLVNGEIRVLSNAEQQPSGSWRSKNKPEDGGWDNTRSTNITNIATNRINEQNKNSTAGERQAYVSVDIAGSSDVTSVTKGGGASASGSSAATYKIGGATFTEEQIQKGAKKYKMSVDEYKKSIGL